jgi:WD40 repeat protein
VWDLASGFGVRELSGIGGPVAAVALSPGGRIAAACGEEPAPGQGKPGGVVVVWNAESGQELRRLETDAAVVSLAFTPDGKRLLVGGADYLRVWELTSGDVLAMISVGGLLGGETVLSLAPSPDGKLALCGLYKSQDARLIDLSNGECVKRFTGHRGMRLLRPAAVAGVAFSGDGEQVLTGSWDQTARVWSREGKQTALFGGHRGRWGWRGVVGVAFLPGGERALSASEDGTVRLWDVKQGDEEYRYDHGARVCCVATSRDGRVAVSGGNDGALRTWELPS